MSVAEMTGLDKRNVNADRSVERQTRSGEELDMGNEASRVSPRFLILGRWMVILFSKLNNKKRMDGLLCREHDGFGRVGLDVLRMGMSSVGEQPGLEPQWLWAFDTQLGVTVVQVIVEAIVVQVIAEAMD